jgi:RNA polymerase sigma-70 factor (ECF subfamily)
MMENVEHNGEHNMEHNEEHNEEQHLLLALAEEDSKVAFSTLYERYHRRLYGFALYLSKNSDEAEELVQTTFVAVWEQRQRVDATQPFGAYLFAIARHHFYDMLRRRIAEQTYVNRVMQEDEPQVYDMEQQIEENDLNRAFNELLSQVPERRRLIFLLSRREHLSYKEIAQRLGISENTVDSQIRHVLDFLRRELPKYTALYVLVDFL